MHRTWLTLHTWVGLAAALFIVVIAASGAAVVFENEIDRALNPATSYVTPAGPPLPVTELVKGAVASRPGDRAIAVRLPEAPWQSLEIATRGRVSVFVDPYTGRILGTRDRQKGLARSLHRLHTELLGGPIGRKVVDWIVALFLVLAVSGLVLWWPRKIVGVRRASSWKRRNFDLHNLVGFYASIVFLVIAGSGILIGFEKTTDPLVKKLNAWNPEPPPLTSTPVAGATAIDPDRALTAARAALPGAFASNISVPAGPKGVYRVLMKFPEDRTPAGRSRAYVDQFSGKVLFVENTRDAPLGTRILNLKRSLHTGDVLGWPTRILYFLVVLGAALQAVTGALVWWNARRGRATGRRA